MSSWQRGQEKHLLCFCPTPSVGSHLQRDTGVGRFQAHWTGDTFAHAGGGLVNNRPEGSGAQGSLPPTPPAPSCPHPESRARAGGSAPEPPPPPQKLTCAPYHAGTAACLRGSRKPRVKAKPSHPSHPWSSSQPPPSLLPAPQPALPLLLTAHVTSTVVCPHGLHFPPSPSGARELSFCLCHFRGLVC